MEFINRVIKKLLKVSKLTPESSKEIRWLLTKGKLSQKKKRILLRILEESKIPTAVSSSTDTDVTNKNDDDRSSMDFGDPSDSEDSTDSTHENVLPNIFVNDVVGDLPLTPSASSPRQSSLVEATDTLGASPQQPALVEAIDSPGIRELQLKKRFYEIYHETFHRSEESSKRYLFNKFVIYIC
jgi:hypothetical protein